MHGDTNASVLLFAGRDQNVSSPACKKALNLGDRGDGASSSSSEPEDEPCSQRSGPRQRLDLRTRQGAAPPNERLTAPYAKSMLWFVQDKRRATEGKEVLETIRNAYVEVRW